MSSSLHTSQYPPLPDSQNTQYGPIYPSANAQVPDDPPPRMPYAPESAFSKLENINEVLQAQQAQQALHANHALTDASSHLPQSQHPEPPQPQQSKSNRLRKACDSCSIRKVKCDEQGPPCRACVSLDIPCTFERPSRRRGPPNRHAEAIKRRRIGDADQASGDSSPQSPTNAAHALAQLQSSHPAQLSADTICPGPTMNALIDDFFMYIHPLCPFPHEPSFREAWERREDFSNPSFLALLASMIAALVSSFPRKPRQHLNTQTRHQYPSHISLVDKCREVCAQARGPGYLDRPSLNVYDACTSYFLGLAGAYVFQWRQMRIYFAECLTILRSLGLHKSETQGYTSLGSDEPRFDGSRDTKVDHITEQIGRRVFWTVFTGIRSIQQLGASFGELTLAPATPSEPFPPLPEEVDDVYIFPQEIQAQPPGVVSLMVGFITNVRIYLSYSTLATAEMAFGVDEIFDWDRQQRVLEQSLQKSRQILDALPDALKVQSKPVRDGDVVPQKQAYHPPTPEMLGSRDHAMNNFAGAESQNARRYEIQKANIYASHLATRSYLVEKYFLQLEKYRKTSIPSSQGSSEVLAAGLDRHSSASTIDPNTLEKLMSHERGQVIKDLLVVLGSIDMVNMEPNADSFVSVHLYLQSSDMLYVAGTDVALSCPIPYFFRLCNLSPIASLRFVPTQTQKIRAIASTLLEMPKEGKDSVALQHQEYLYKFLDILSKLERVSPEASGQTDSSLDEESELRLWADLREQQRRFQEHGGVYGFA